MTRDAIVYLRGHRKRQLLMPASSQTIVAVGILSEPCLAVAADRVDRALGASIRQALDGAQIGVPMLRLAGVPSWKAFATGASCIAATEDGAQTTVVPRTTTAGRLLSDGR